MGTERNILLGSTETFDMQKHNFLIPIVTYITLARRGNILRMKSILIWIEGTPPH